MFNKGKEFAAKLPSLLEEWSSAYFSLKNPPVVGIDITPNAVKLLVLERHDKEYVVKNFAMVLLPPGTVVDRKIKQPEKISEAIKQGMQLAKCNLEHAAIALPTANVITKVIQMNAALSEFELEEEIEFEAEKYIPHPMENVSLDYHVLGPVEADPTKANVLLVASLTTNVEERIQLVASTGLDVSVVDVESYATERALTQTLNRSTRAGATKTPGATALFDINTGMLSLLVIANNQLIYVHEEMFGGNELTKLIKQKYGLSREQAEYAKLSGELKADYLTELFPLLQGNIFTQIQRCLQFFSSSNFYMKIENVLLSGEAATIADFAPWLQTQLGIPVGLANPLQNMTIAKDIDEQFLQKNAASLMIAIGLALRGFD